MAEGQWAVNGNEAAKLEQLRQAVMDAIRMIASQEYGQAYERLLFAEEPGRRNG